MTTPVKLFVAIRSEQESRVPGIEERLISEYGVVDHRSSVIPLAGAIHLVLLSFERLIDADQLPGIRRHTRSIAEAGHLENSKVVADTDIMLFRNGKAQLLPVTPPHYRPDAVLDFFLTMRRLYRDQLRTMCLLKR